MNVWTSHTAVAAPGGNVSLAWKGIVVDAAGIFLFRRGIPPSQ